MFGAMESCRQVQLNGRRMRIYVGVVLRLLAAPAAAHDTNGIGCGGEPGRDAVPLTEAESDAVRRGDREFSALVGEVVAEQAESLKDNLPRLTEAKDVGWGEAKRLVLLGVIHTPLQWHDLVVHLVSDSGAVYRTKEPKIDEIRKVARVVDPCGLFIAHITE